MFDLFFRVLAGGVNSYIFVARAKDGELIGGGLNAVCIHDVLQAPILSPALLRAHSSFISTALVVCQRLDAKADKAPVLEQRITTRTPQGIHVNMSLCEALLTLLVFIAHRRAQTQEVKWRNI